MNTLVIVNKRNDDTVWCIKGHFIFSKIRQKFRNTHVVNSWGVVLTIYREDKSLYVWHGSVYIIHIALLPAYEYPFQNYEYEIMEVEIPWEVWKFRCLCHCYVKIQHTHIGLWQEISDHLKLYKSTLNSKSSVRKWYFHS